MLTGGGGSKYVEAGADLIERARRDPAAFGEIYDLYLRRVYAFCLAQTKNEAEAEDLTAVTFERALSAIKRYQHRGPPFSSWLFRIAANLVADQRRRRSREFLVGGDPRPEKAEMGAEETNPAAIVEQWERAAWLRTHIASLPPDQQQVLRLRFWEGQSTPIVAQRMGRSEGAVKQLLHRATVALRARIQQESTSNG